MEWNVWVLLRFAFVTTLFSIFVYFQYFPIIFTLATQRLVHLCSSFFSIFPVQGFLDLFRVWLLYVVFFILSLLSTQGSFINIIFLVSVFGLVIFHFSLPLLCLAT